MEVSVKIDLKNDDKIDLARILSCEPKDLPEVLGDYGSAALQEYVSLFLGQKAFRRGSDINEYRLFLLIGTVFKHRIPDEQEVCRLFQTTASESRALIRATMSKYQYQLRAAVENSVRQVLSGAKQIEEDGDHVVTINSRNVVEELNRALANIDGGLKQVKKQAGSVSKYEISPASHARLLSHYAGHE